MHVLRMHVCTLYVYINICIYVHNFMYMPNFWTMNVCTCIIHNISMQIYDRISTCIQNNILQLNHIISSALLFNSLENFFLLTFKTIKM